MNSNLYMPVRAASIAVLALVLIGCGDPPPVKPTGPTSESPPAMGTPTDKATSERAKLDPEDRAIVDAQEWCVIATDVRLGAMGPPIKLTLKGQPVFVCCNNCVRKAEAKPDATLTIAAELKAKAKLKTP